MWPGGKSAALALNLPGSIPGHSPIFRVVLALLLLNDKHYDTGSQLYTWQTDTEQLLIQVV